LPYLHTYFYFVSKKLGFLENEWMSEGNYKDNEYAENILRNIWCGPQISRVFKSNFSA